MSTYLRYAREEHLRRPARRHSVVACHCPGNAVPARRNDLHDYVQKRLGRACAGKHEGAIIVSDDWPDEVPIGDAELRAIEGHMRSELDELFGPLP